MLIYPAALPHALVLAKHHTRLALLAILIFTCQPLVGLAQMPQLNADQQEQQDKPEEPSDPLGRGSPRGTFSGYIDAVAEEDYAKAAQFLDLNHLPAGQRAERGRELAQVLQVALDRGNVPPSVMISDNAEGDTDDNLGLEVERLGVVEVAGEQVPLLLRRTGEGETAVWRVASQTLTQLPQSFDDNDELLVNRLLPQALIERRWNGVPIGHWLAVLALIAAAYLLSKLITRAVVSLLRILLKRRIADYPEGLVHAFSVPIQLYLSVLLFVTAAQQLGISIILRQYFSEAAIAVAWVAILLLGWRLIDVVATLGERRATRKANQGALSAILFFRRSVKVLLVAVGIITILDTVGIDVTTGLAALGIGGIAIALGAQKTIENLVGSLTLIFDQPVRVGDFCKVGDTLGTIEQIGMRSTRIRTLDRTIVVIPNGDFSAQKIENYNHRDRFWFHPTLTLRYETSPDQIRYLLVELRAMLYAHPKVDPDPARVRFTGFGSSAITIDIFAYVFALDFNEYLEVQEDLNLRIADVVAASGTGFAFPSQTLYMSRDGGLSEEKTRAAEARVQQWRENGELQIPSFDPEHIEKIKQTIAYPPPGSSRASKN